MRRLALLSIVALTSLAACESSDPEDGSPKPSHAEPWAQSFGDVTRLDEIRVAAADDGRLAITGTFAGKIDLGGGTLTSQEAENYEDEDVFCASFAADGGHLWSGAARAAKDQKGTGAAIDSFGNTFFVGAFREEIDLGKGAMEARGSAAWLARFDASGKAVWTKAVTGMGDGFASTTVNPSAGIALGDDGTLVVAGSLIGYVSFGGVPINGGSRSTFVAKLDVDGNHVFSFAFGGGSHNAYGVAVGPSGEVFVVGDHQSTISLGDTTLDGYGRGYVAMVKPDGSPGWLIGSEGEGGTTVTSVAATADGGAIVGGCTGGNPTFGGHALGAAHFNNGFVASVTAKGAVDWLTVLPGTCVMSLAIDASNQIHAGGNYSEGPDLGTGPLHWASPYAPVLVALDEKGTVTKARTFGDDAFGMVTGVVATGNDVVISGTFDIITIDDAKLEAKGESDIFIARTH